MALTEVDCRTVAALLVDAADRLPDGASNVRATLGILAREYDKAAKCAIIADELGRPYEIVACGGLARGATVILPGGECEVRRISDTGVEIRLDGFWNWEDVTSRATPMVQV